MSEVIGAGAAFPLLLKLFGTSAASILACLFGIGTVAWVPPQLAEPTAAVAATIGTAAIASGRWVNRRAWPDSTPPPAELPPALPRPALSHTQTENNTKVPSFPNAVPHGYGADEAMWPSVGTALLESELAEALLRVTRDALLRSLSSEPTAFEVEATGIEQSTLEKCWRVRQSSGRNDHHSPQYGSAVSDAEERTAVCSMVRTLELRRLGHLQSLLLHRPKDLPVSAATANVRGASSGVSEVALSHWVNEVHEWTTSVRAAVLAVVDHEHDGSVGDSTSVPGLFDAMARDGVGAVLLAFASRGASPLSILPTNAPPVRMNMSAPVAAVTLNGGSQSMIDEWDKDLAAAVALPAARVRLLVALELATSAEASSWQRHVTRLRRVLGRGSKSDRQQQRPPQVLPSSANTSSAQPNLDATIEEGSEQTIDEKITGMPIDDESTTSKISTEAAVVSGADSSTEEAVAAEVGSKNMMSANATNEAVTAQASSTGNLTNSFAAAPPMVAAAPRSSGALGWVLGKGLRRDRFLVRLPSGRLIAVPVRKPLQLAARLSAAVMAHRWMKDSPHVDSLGRMAKHQSRLLWRTTRGILERRFAVLHALLELTRNSKKGCLIT